ncbi:hypothetical protein [Photobacterium swingsii]|uniref:hypothetical protein n=1 Tax=Photobacterium swingsii TaxID=680026 RepID=UPI00406908D4
MREYERLENDKRNGWSKYNNLNHSAEERYEGAIMVITCHFERSLNANPDGHISFEQYISSWLSANQCEFINVREKLQKDYPPLNHPLLECGTSYFL